MKKPFLSKPVLILSLVSFFNDVASEMLYPVLPIFLQSAGFSVLYIGILEGIAEAAAGLSKGYFGRWSDFTGRRVPFIRWGYALIAIAKPMMVMVVHPLWILMSRTLDRLGKGLRTGARDALLADQSDEVYRARVFGFHRSMDTLGAVLGPCLSLLFLYFFPGKYRELFFMAFIPGILAVSLTFLLKDKKEHKNFVKKTPGAFFSFLNYVKNAPKQYKLLLAGLIWFALFNSSDVFLILKLKDLGWSDFSIVGVYIFFNLMYAVFAFPFGILADRLGVKRIFVGGLIIFSFVYAGMGWVHNKFLIIGLFILYGLYSAATEGIGKAWISLLVDSKDRATAIGSYAAFQSVAMMMAGALTGVLWQFFGPHIAFMTSSLMALLVAVYLTLTIQTR